MTTRQGNLRALLRTVQLQNLLLLLGITLQIADVTRSTGMSLMIAWLSITFLLKLKQTFPTTPNQGSFAGYGALLGLILVQTGTLVRAEDETGFSQYFCIAAGIAAMASLSHVQRVRLIQWIGASAIPLAVFYLLNILGHPSLIQDPISKAFADIGELRSVLQETVFAFLTTTAFVALRLSKSTLGQSIAIIGLTCGIILCLNIDSRIACISPLLAITLAYIVSHGKRLYNINRSLKNIPLILTSAGLAISSYSIVIAPDLIHDSLSLLSDRGRINVALCWLRSIFYGNNHFLLGSGYDRSSIMKLCTDQKVGNFWVFDATGDPSTSAGHAHNVFAHFIALHGMTGLLSLSVLAFIYFTYLYACIKNERDIFKKTNGTILLRSCSWSEATITLAIFMALCSMATTFYIYNHILQILIGIALGMPVAIEANCQPRGSTSDTP